MQILGFGPTGKPILPPTAHSTDPETIRREKMGWEEISRQASKIISFSGEFLARVHCDPLCLTSLMLFHHRLGRA